MVQLRDGWSNSESVKIASIDCCINLYEYSWKTYKPFVKFKAYDFKAYEWLYYIQYNFICVVISEKPIKNKINDLPCVG